ncbi:MAG: alginate O-acetyltransferase AlgX-related protein [Candidatus Rokuibacteriota bacterium]
MSAGRRRARGRTVWRGLGRAALLVLITFALAEVTLRTYHAFHPVFVFHGGSPSRFRGQPFGDDYDFRLNSRGFKDLEFTAKQPGVFRVVALGDSVAFGVVPYRFNFLTILEEMLAGRGRPIEILNLGIPAIGPADYLSVFVTEGVDLAPDLVLVSFFIGNDFTDDVRRTRPLHSYSYVVTLLRYLGRVRHVTDNLFPGHGRRAYDDAAPTFSDEMFLHIEAARGPIYWNDFGRFDAMVAQAVESLRQLKQVCDRARIGLLVVMVPSEVQVDPALQQKVVTAMRRRPDELDFARPNAILAARLKGLGIESFDLLEAFRTGARTTRLYKPNDTHWNIAGNRLAAETIEAYLGPRIR